MRRQGLELTRFRGHFPLGGEGSPGIRARTLQRAESDGVCDESDVRRALRIVIEP